MWILPRQLHTSPFVPDTAALISDSNELCEIFGQSLTARGTLIPSRTWSRKLKRDGWTRHLSGRILKPSRGESFADSWTSSLADTRANHSQWLGCVVGTATKTDGTCGLGSETGSGSCSPSSASSRTSMDTSRLDSPRSSLIWRRLVTEQRGDYSRRLALVRATSGAAYSSLPTPCANEDSFRLNGSSQQSKTLEARSRRGELITAGQTIPRGPLNPVFVETMMGLPPGWTDSDSRETGSCLVSPSTLSASSSPA